jgi:hypothetical protein
MTFPFAITQEIRDAYEGHQAYCSAGQAWLIRNDPEGQNEQELLEEISTQIQSAAEQHFGDDEDAYWEFYDEWRLGATGGKWFEVLEAEFEATE